MHSSKDNSPLALIVSLFQTLNEREIKYCHWKSNCNLEKSMGGLTDLDLLVDRNHSLRFRELLCQHDFKPVLSHPLRQYPAIEDYLGFDRDSGRLVHLHVHYQLILGEQFVKNYHLPLERSFLECTDICLGVKVPAPELEIIVLVVRALLKYRDRDFVRSILSARHGGLPAGIVKELEYLLNRTTIEKIAGVLESEVDFLSPDIVLEFLTAVTKSPKSAYAVYGLRARLRRELAPFQRHSRQQATVRYFWAALLPRHRLLHLQSPASRKKIMMSGGIMAAVVGADGAGKSTVVRELQEWLSWRLRGCTYYMGSNQPSTITKLFGWGLKISGIVYRVCRTLIGATNILSKSLYVPHRLFQYLHYIAIGLDRYNRFIAGQRRASQGFIVICDRYPLEAVPISGHFMDGPRIASLHQGEMGPMVKGLFQTEQSIYRRIRPPDHLFVLRVSPSVSLQRKPDHKPGTVTSKTQALNRMDRKGLSVTEIDANRPLDQVLLQVKTTLWDLL